MWDSLGPISAPTAVLDLDAFEANREEMLRRAAGTRIRVASKSLRVRGLIERILATDGYAGVLGYSAAEAVWLVQHGVRDVVVAYPSVDTTAFAQVAADADLAREITFMVDLPEHLQLLDAAAQDVPLRACLDVDSSLHLRSLHVGVHRSSVLGADQAVAMAQAAERLTGVDLVGVMFYDAQVAGVPDSNPAVRLMKRRSLVQLSRRRAEVLDALASYVRLEFVNAGGTGSLHTTGRDKRITELAAGSGFFTPTLFDGYDGTQLRPAAYFASPVTRKPRPDVAVTFSGGYVASGPASTSRMPTPVHPAGLRYFGQEGPGEVQTPLHGAAAVDLTVGDTVWFRHAKAGEMCSRFNEIVLVRAGEIVDRLPTYRGEGQNFG